MPAERLSEPQQRILDRARELAEVVRATGAHFHGHMVSGRAYWSAAALERKGYGRLQYQGPSQGWFFPTTEDKR